MYSSNSSLNVNDLISSYPIQQFCSRPFSIESNNPTSTTQQSTEETNNCALLPPLLSFFQFPSPFEENHEIFLEQHHHDFLLHHQLAEMEYSVNNNCRNTTATVIQPQPQFKTLINNKNTNTLGQGNTTDQIPTRRRSSKKDRHSKIKTARGLRDRRMRLSLEVAKRFFGLQDMLGFEKASKTVEWLLNRAKVEIKQLAREKNIHHPSCNNTAKSASSTSECEGVSSLDEVAERKPIPIVHKRRVKHSRKSALKPIGRESREKARERARERTKEKMRTRMQSNEATNNHNLNRLGSWNINPFETTVEEGAGTQSQSVNPSLVEERSSQAKEHVEDLAHEDSLVIMSKWSPTMIFNSLNNSGILQDQHQFAELQSMGKPWEAYNNHNI